MGRGRFVNPDEERAGWPVRRLTVREWVQIVPTEFVLRGSCLAPLLEDASRVTVVAVPFDRIQRGDIVAITLSGQMFCHQVAARRAGFLCTRGIRDQRLDPPIGPDDVIGLAVRGQSPDGAVLDLERRAFRLGSRFLALVGLSLSKLGATAPGRDLAFAPGPRNLCRRIAGGALRRVCSLMAIVLRKVCLVRANDLRIRGSILNAHYVCHSR